MDRRVAFLISGVTVLGALVWLTTRIRPNESEVRQSPPRDLAESTAPVPAAANPPISAVRTSEDAPASPGYDAAAVPIAANQSAHAAGGPLQIDVSPGFEFLDRTPAEMKDTDPMWSSWRRHQQLESETRDEALAPRMEAALRDGVEDALTMRGFDTQRIELPVVECRTNACEIQAVGYAIDNMKPGVDFQSVLAAVLRGNLGSEFDLAGFGLLMSPRADGRLTFLALIPRKKN
jgi:hypothetical protein